MLPAAKEKTKISKAGRLNNLRNTSGFTLVELVVVIAIISTLLFFSMPMFKATGIFQNKDREIGELIQLIQSLKHRSIQENMDFALHFSLDSNRVWITDSTMDETSLQNARDEKIELFHDLKITRIEFPPGANGMGREAPVIGFSRKGYSDMVILHLDDGDDLVSLKIEPFLMEVESIPGHISFDDCI